MFVSFFLCQFLRADDATQQLNPDNNTARRIRSFYNTDSPPKFLHYPCAKARDTACGIWTELKGCIFPAKPKEEIDFNNMIGSALVKMAQDTHGDNMSRNLQELRDWFKKADLSKEGLPDIWLNWIEKLIPHDKKMKSMKEMMAVVLPTQILQSVVQDIFAPNDNSVRSSNMLNTQIKYDVKSLLLAIQLEHICLKLDTPQNWDGSYFDLCSKHMSAMVQLLRYPVTATAPWLKDWLKYAERYDSITKMQGWSEICDRIRYPYLDDTHILCRFVYDAAFMGVLAMSVFSLYLWYYNNPFFVALLADLGIISGTNAHQAFTRSVVEGTAPSPSLVEPLRRGMQTAGIDILGNVTRVVQNSSLALRALAEASASMPCDERARWLRNIFGQAVNTEGNWVTCIMSLVASNMTRVTCQMLSIGNQDVSAFGQCQPPLSGIIGYDTAEITFGDGGIIYRPGPRSFNVSTPNPTSPPTTEAVTPPPSTNQPTTPPPPKKHTRTPSKGTGAGTDSFSEKMTNTNEKSNSLSVSRFLSKTASMALSVVQKLAPDLAACLAWLKPIRDLDGFRGLEGLMDGGDCNISYANASYYPPVLNQSVPQILDWTMGVGGAGDHNSIVWRIGNMSASSLYRFIKTLANVPEAGLTTTQAEAVQTVFPLALQRCMQVPEVPYQDYQLRNETMVCRIFCSPYTDCAACSWWEPDYPGIKINNNNLPTTARYFLWMNNLGGLFQIMRNASVDPVIQSHAVTYYQKVLFVTGGLPYSGGVTYDLFPNLRLVLCAVPNVFPNAYLAKQFPI